MHRPSFPGFHRVDRLQDQHGFHLDLSPTLTFTLTIVVPMLVIVAVWEMIKFAVYSMWIALPAPLAWGNWPLLH
jgi:hypothetical protein